MLREGFSSGFDTLLNSMAHSAGFGSDTSTLDIRVDEYEKSFFLTKAQEEIALSLYKGNTAYSDGFEQTEEMRRYLADLVREAELSPVTPLNVKGMDENNSTFFKLPCDTEDPVWFITYEEVKLSNGKCGKDSTQYVYPATQDEYHKIKKNPYRGPNDRRALRLDLSDNIVEIISKYKVSTYYIRYLRKIKPIILSDLDGNEVQGVTTAPTTNEVCELPESLHQRILEEAVRMALQSRSLSRVNKE